MKLSENFLESDFRCRCGCGLLILHPGFIESLQAVRTQFGRPMNVTSGCRCEPYNARVGGNSRSLHVCDRQQRPGQQGALAADIATPDGFYRGALFKTAWEHGFSIGWNAKRGFLHLDRRDFIGLPQNSFDY